MAIMKTWMTNSGTSARDTHYRMNGETVEVGQTFSNGMLFPGDSSDPAETVNCNCTISVEGKALASRLHLPNWQTADKYARGTYGDWRSSLTSRELNSIQRYVGSSSDINRYLRKGLGGETRYGTSATIKESADNISAALERGIAKEAQTVWRGIPSNYDFKVGQIFHDKGFMSTTMSRQTAEKFGSNILEIRIPKGTQGLGHISALRGNSFVDEVEILLQKGTRLRVVEVGNLSTGRYGIAQRRILCEIITEAPVQGVVERTIELERWADATIDKVLQKGTLVFGEPVGTGISAPHFGTVTLGKDTIKVIIKKPGYAGAPSAAAEQAAEEAAVRINSLYGFDTLAPRTMANGDYIVSALADGSTPAQIFKATGKSGLELVESMAREERVRVAFFDTVIGNADRNFGNFIINSEGRAILFDHGSAFGGAPGRTGRVIYDSLSASDRLLSASQKKILQKMWQDRRRVSEKIWAQNIDIDSMFARVRHILDEGRW